MFRKRDKDGLPEARLVGCSARRRPKAPVPAESDDREAYSNDELASLFPMLFLIGILVLILWGAAR